MKQRTAISVLLAVALLALPCTAKPKSKTFDFPAKDVFFAALKVAQSEHVVNYIDEKNLWFSFSTGGGWFSEGFNCNASVKAKSSHKSTLVINVQRKEARTISYFGAGGRTAKKFFKLVEAELQESK